MIRRRTAAIAAGAVLLLSGVAVGCTAADAGAPDNKPGAGAPSDTNKRPRDHSKLVTALAEGLGIDESKAQAAVDKALDEVMGDRRDRGPKPAGDPAESSKPGNGQPSTAPESGKPSTAPESGKPSTAPETGKPSTAPETGKPSAPAGETSRDSMAQRLAAVIAKELNADEAKVLQIVQDNMPERPEPGDRGERGERGDRGERPGRPDDSGNTATPSPEPTR